MAIFLTILKVIGIILLCILGLVILLMLLALFVPVRYRVKGTIDHKDVDVKANLSWLLHLFSANVEYSKDLSVILRILFIKKKLIDPSDTDDTVDNKSADEKAEPEIDYYNANMAQNMKSPEEIAKLEIPESSTDIAEGSLEDIETDDDPWSDFDDEADDAKPKKGGKLKSIVDKIEGIFEKIKGIIDKIRDTKDKLTKPSSKAAISHLKDEIIRLLKIIMPRKLFLRALFSAGSPDKTGMALGVLAMFPIGYKNRWNITPDFESDEFYIQGDFDIKGRVFAFQILGVGLRILLDKNCRKLYNEFR